MRRRATTVARKKRKKARKRQVKDTEEMLRKLSIISSSILREDPYSKTES